MHFLTWHSPLLKKIHGSGALLDTSLWKRALVIWVVFQTFWQHSICNAGEFMVCIWITSRAIGFGKLLIKSFHNLSQWVSSLTRLTSVKSADSHSVSLKHHFYSVLWTKRKHWENKAAFLSSSGRAYSAVLIKKLLTTKLVSRSKNIYLKKNVHVFDHIILHLPNTHPNIKNTSQMPNWLPKYQIHIPKYQMHNPKCQIRTPKGQTRREVNQKLSKVKKNYWEYCKKRSVSVSWKEVLVFH